MLPGEVRCRRPAHPRPEENGDHTPECLSLRFWRWVTARDEGQQQRVRDKAHASRPELDSGDTPRRTECVCKSLCPSPRWQLCAGVGVLWHAAPTPVASRSGSAVGSSPAHTERAGRALSTAELTFQVAPLICTARTGTPHSQALRLLRKPRATDPPVPCFPQPSRSPAGCLLTT